MAAAIRQPPSIFNADAFCNRWFSWRDIQACFWPGQGKKAINVNPKLAPVRDLGGVYLLSWAVSLPKTFSPAARSVCYVGETNCFRRRMGDFGNSAGLWGARAKGHSAGWRWPKGRSHHLWVAFFPLGGDMPSHLAEGFRKWMESVAIEEHRCARGALPRLNEKQKGAIQLD